MSVAIQFYNCLLLTVSYLKLIRFLLIIKPYKRQPPMPSYQAKEQCSHNENNNLHFLFVPAKLIYHINWSNGWRCVIEITCCLGFMTPLPVPVWWDKWYQCQAVVIGIRGNFNSCDLFGTSLLSGAIDASHVWTLSASPGAGPLWRIRDREEGP